MPLFSRTGMDLMESGNKHLEQACDEKRDLTAEQVRKELQKAIDDFARALNWVSEKEKYGEAYLEQRRASFSPLKYYYDDRQQYSVREYVLTKIAWTFLLDGQYDKSQKYLDTWWGEGYPATVSWKEERDLLRARIFALKGNHDEALNLYSEVIGRTSGPVAHVRDTYWKICCDTRTEKEVLKAKLGNPNSLFLPTYWFHRNNLDGIGTFYCPDFMERFQKEGPETLFPRLPSAKLDRCYFVFLITSKDLEVFPPVQRLRKSTVFANAAQETAQSYHVRGDRDYMIMLPDQGKPNAFPLPFPGGIILFWLTKIEQIARFIEDVQTRMKIEHIHCYYPGER